VGPRGRTALDNLLGFMDCKGTATNSEARRRIIFFLHVSVEVGSVLVRVGRCSSTAPCTSTGTARRVHEGRGLCRWPPGRDLATVGEKLNGALRSKRDNF
jgi:hypothetical protein